LMTLSALSTLRARRPLSTLRALRALRTRRGDITHRQIRIRRTSPLNRDHICRLSRGPVT
jgi:hypothetical protein